MIYTNKKEMFMKLRREGIIEKVEGGYKVQDRHMSQVNCFKSSGIVYDENEVINQFLDHHEIEVLENGTRKTTLFIPNDMLDRSPKLKKIDREGYHYTSTHSNYSLKLDELREKGVKVSYGLEYEVHSLTARQESSLVDVLNRLKNKYGIEYGTEEDSSLGASGVEIVFSPMDASTLKHVWNTLREFVSKYNVDMENTGAHITSGRLDYQGGINARDIQFRLSRVAITLYALTNQDERVAIFGRDFNDYCNRPTSVSGNVDHYNALTIANRHNCYECRLPNYNGNIDRIVKFINASLCVYDGVFNADSMKKIADSVKE